MSPLTEIEELIAGFGRRVGAHGRAPGCRPRRVALVAPGRTAVRPYQRGEYPIVSLNLQKRVAKTAPSRFSLLEQAYLGQPGV